MGNDRSCDNKNILAADAPETAGACAPELAHVSADSIARAFLSNYLCIYCVNTKTSRYRICSRSEAYGALQLDEGEADFFAFLRNTVAQLVHPEDRPQFLEALARDKLLSVLDSLQAYTLSFRIEYGGEIHYVRLKAARLRDRANGILVGVSDIDAQMREKEEYDRAQSSSLTYSHIAQALSRDYVYLYYVDLKTDRFIEYSSHLSKDDLSEERHSEDFFGVSRREALQRIYPDDQTRFLEAFTKENIIRVLDKHGVFALNYRLMVDGAPIYVNMKISRMAVDDSHIIIGVSSIDAQMRYQEIIDRVASERITYARITALSGDYVAIYTVDPVSGRYDEYITTGDYEGFGFAKEGDDFFSAARADGTRTLYMEDLDLFLSVFTKENVMDAIAKQGFFTLNYRLMIGGVPTYVNLKVCQIDEKDGPRLIVGVLNVNDQVRRDQEYAHNLSVARNKANFDALTGVKNKHAYIDVEARLNHQIEEGLPVQFALVVCDVNDLKIVNDTLGHQAGDRYLQQARTILCGIFRNSAVFRVGGDEFAVIIQGQDYGNVEAQAAELDAVNLRNRSSGEIVIACGMAKYEGDRSVAAVFERADRLMYQNKRQLKEG